MVVKRIERDAYFTPDWVTDRLLDNWGNTFHPHDRILEPCCGDGSMIDRLKKYLPCEFHGTDIVMGEEFDATKKSYWDNFEGHFDYVVTNPPFNAAPKILEHALDHSAKGVFMLLRLNFLEPCPGGKTARAHVLTKYDDNFRFILPLNPRPRFRTDVNSTDSVTSAWFVWLHDFSWRERGLACPFVFQ